LTLLKGIENLINLKYLNCGYNFLTSLEGIENFVDLEKLYCGNNQLRSFEGIEILIKLIKNNKKLRNELNYNFIDSDDFIELHYLFKNLIWCKNYDKINEYIEQIEQMIIELNGFQNYVLK
jgi:Leucine-rich repeat (LRR) protein